MKTITITGWQDSAESAGHAAVAESARSICAADVAALDDLIVIGLAAELAPIVGANGERGVTVDELAEAAGASPAHAWVIERWLDELLAGGWVDELPDRRWRPTRTPSRAELRRARRAMVESCRRLGYTQHLPHLLLESLRLTPDLLRGVTSVQALLFPGGGGEASSEVYGDNVISRYLNAAAAAVVHSVAVQRAHPLRILELGAGVGATTRPVLDALDSDQVERFVFTDLSPHFLHDAAARFADRAWADRVHYALLDITRPLAPQLESYDPDLARPGRVDVVLAATMAHNAVDVPALLRAVRELLASGGVVILVETVVEHAQSLTTMPFALSRPDGGGPPARTDLRAGSGRTYLSRSEWVTVLEEAGFRIAVDLPGETDPLCALDQRVFCAVRD